MSLNIGSLAGRVLSPSRSSLTTLSFSLGLPMTKAYQPPQDVSAPTPDPAPFSHAVDLLLSPCDQGALVFANPPPPPAPPSSATPAATHRGTDDTMPTVDVCRPRQALARAAAAQARDGGTHHHPSLREDDTNNNQNQHQNQHQHQHQNQRQQQQQHHHHHNSNKAPSAQGAAQDARTDASGDNPAYHGARVHVGILSSQLRDTTTGHFVEHLTAFLAREGRSLGIPPWVWHHHTRAAPQPFKVTIVLPRPFGDNVTRRILGHAHRLVKLDDTRNITDVQQRLAEEVRCGFCCCFCCRVLVLV